MIPEKLALQMSASGVVAVVTVEDVDDAVPVARALHAGGVSIIELTFRTPGAADAIRRIRDGLPDVVVGAGTLLTARQVSEAVNAGAAFGVAPGCNPTTIQAAGDAGLPFAPGVMTPTDIEIALSHDCRVLKFFPAATSGGLVHLNTMAAPFTHHGLQFIPLGGIDGADLAHYLKSPLVLCVGGSWLAPRDLMRRKDWIGVRERALNASQIVQATRAGA